MKNNKTKTKTHTEKENQRKNHKIRKGELNKRRRSISRLKKNLLKKMKVMGRLEPATFRFKGEHVNH